MASELLTQQTSRPGVSRDDLCFAMPVTRGQIRYGAPDGVLVYLINETVNGTPRRRLAARFVLDCLRSYRTPEETEACLHELEETALLQLAADVHEMTSGLGLN